MAQARSDDKTTTLPVSVETPESDSGGADSTVSSDDSTVAGDLIPGWLALLVLVLLLAVAALGGYLIRGAIVDSRIETPAELAVVDLEAQVEADPENPERLLALGYAYQQEARYEEALALYEQTLALDEGNTGALYNKGVTLTLLGRVKDAEDAYWDVLAVAPDHALAAKALGEYYVAKKQYKSALVALEPVIEARPQYADLQYLAGYSCEQLGITETAITYYRGALTYNPDYQEAKDGLARLGASEKAQ